MFNDTSGMTSRVASNSSSAWIVIDSIIIFFTLAGNSLSISAIVLNKKIYELLSNRYIFSLAISDLMVGLTLPYHLIFTIENTLSKYQSTCILRFVLIILACSSSIYNLLAIATDRYVAIVFPFLYSRRMNKRIVACIIVAGWCLSLSIATAPIYWNTWSADQKCTMEKVLPDTYVHFIITPMFLSIWLAMLILYFRIWREASHHERRIRTAANFNSKQTKLKENKSVQMVLLILGCFSVCWLPYFITIICMYNSSGTTTTLTYEVTFTLAVTNSCMNPLIYAWKSKNYRDAFKCLLRCKSPRTLHQEANFITDHVPTDRAKRYSAAVASIENDCKNLELDCAKCDKSINGEITASTCIE